MVELLSTNPAKLFGLYPRKGTIAPGSDADIVIFDPEKRHLITAETQQSRTDYNLYEGTEVYRFARDRAASRYGARRLGELVAEPGVGQFVERAAFGQELLPLRHADETKRGGAPDTFPLVLRPPRSDRGGNDVFPHVPLPLRRSRIRRADPRSRQSLKTRQPSCRCRSGPSTAWWSG